MKEKDYKRYKKRVHKLLKQWIPLLKLDAWYIQVDWYDDKTEFAKGGNRFTAMQIDVDWHYFRARLSVCVPVIAEIDDDRLEWGVVHELCHIIANEMRENDPDLKHEERVVSHLASAFLSVRGATNVS